MYGGTPGRDQGKGREPSQGTCRQAGEGEVGMCQAAEVGCGEAFTPEHRILGAAK